MTPHDARREVLIKVALMAGAVFASSGNATADGLSTGELLKRAQTSVFRIEVKRGQNPGAIGSVVALSLSPKDQGKPRIATFATAYHVMQLATGFIITNYAHKPVATVTPRTRCYAARTKDIAFLQVEIDEGADELIQPISTEDFLPRPIRSGAPAEREEGIAFGFSEEQSLPIDYSQIEFLGPASASDLEIVRRGAQGSNVRSDEGMPGNMTFRLVGRDVTFRGMSGGLVTNRSWKFAGLVFGRKVDRYSLIIPADMVEKTRIKAGDPSNWPLFAAEVFETKSPFRGTLKGEIEEPFLDKEDWGTVDGLVVLMGEDPTRALGHFQEISVTPPELGANAKPVSVVVKGDTFKGGGEQSIEMSLDGANPRPLGLNESYEIELKKPGEALLLVKKISGKVNDFEAGRFLAPSIVDLSFQQGDYEFMRVTRSLPQVVQGYPLFITVRRSESDLPRVAEERPANARIAIRLDFAQGILNQAPFALSLAEKSGDDKNQFKGIYRQKLEDAWSLNFGTSQQLNVSAGGHIEVSDAKHADVGVTLARDQLDKPLPIDFRGVVQFPAQFDSFFISSRITGAKGKFPLNVKLSETFEANVGGIARHLFSTHLNNKFLFYGVPRMTDKDLVGKFMKELGLSAPGGWEPEPRQIALVQTQGGKAWLIATVRIDRKVGVGNGDAPKVYPELLQAPDDSSDSAFDIRAFGIPGETVAGLPGIATENPLAAQGLSSATVKELHLSVAAPLPADKESRLESLGTQIPISTNDTAALSKRIKDAFTRAALRGKTIVSITLSAESAPAALARAVEAKAPPLSGELGSCLNLTLGHDRDGYEAGAKLDNGPFTLGTPKGKLLPLSDTVRILDATLTIEKLDAHGKGRENEILGGCSAELRAAKVEAGSVHLENLSAHLDLTIDTRTKEAPISGSIRLLAGDLTIKEFGTLKLAKSPDFPFQFDRSLKLRFDVAEFTKFAVSALIGVPTGGK